MNIGENTGRQTESGPYAGTISLLQMAKADKTALQYRATTSAQTSTVESCPYWLHTEQLYDVVPA